MKREIKKLRGIYEYPLGSGLWCVQYFDAGGRRRRERAGTRGMAIELLRKRKTDILAGRKLPEKLRGASCPTLEGFAQRFMDAIQVQCAAKAKTVEFYAQQMKRLLDFEPLRIARLSDIDEALIQAFVQHRSAQVGVVTVNSALRTLRRAMRLAQEWRVIDRLPRFRLLPGEPRREWVLKRELEGTYLNACPQPLRDAAMLMLDTGLRAGEALALEWQDIRLSPEPGYVQVRAGKSRYARRAVPLTGRVRGMLADRRRAAESAWVFSEFSRSLNGASRISSLDHQHVRVRRALGLPREFVIHSLRHSFCTRLGEAGTEAFLIQRMAGHHSVTVSERYVHPTPEAMLLAMARLDAANQGLAGVPTATGTATRSLAMSVSH